MVKRESYKVKSVHYVHYVHYVHHVKEEVKMGMVTMGVTFLVEENNRDYLVCSNFWKGFEVLFRVKASFLLCVCVCAHD